MRPSTGSKRTHLSWFLPIGVFVDLFSVAQGNMRKTAHATYDFDYGAYFLFIDAETLSTSLPLL